MPEDYEITGYDRQSDSVIQWNAEDEDYYQCGESPEEYGVFNMTAAEIQCLLRDGWTPQTDLLDGADMGNLLTAGWTP